MMKARLADGQPWGLLVFLHLFLVLTVAQIRWTATGSTNTATITKVDPVLGSVQAFGLYTTTNLDTGGVMTFMAPRSLTVLVDFQHPSLETAHGTILGPWGVPITNTSMTCRAIIMAIGSILTSVSSSINMITTPASGMTKVKLAVGQLWALVVCRLGSWVTETHVC